MNKPINLKKEIWTLSAALVGLFLILFGASSRMIELSAILCCTAVVLFSKDDVLVICCMACWMNVAQVFKLSVDGTSIYTMLGMLFAVKQLIKHRKIEKNFLVILLIYFLYLVLGMGNQFMNVIKVIMMPIQLYLMAIQLDYRGLKRVSGYFILGLIIESTAAINSSLIPGLSNYMSNSNVFAVATLEGYVPEARFVALWRDPNYYSIHLVIGIVICVVLYSRREINAFIFTSVVAVLTYFGAKTLSKSFILMFVLIMAYAYLIFLHHKQYGSVILISLGFLILIALVAAGSIDAFSLIVERLKEGMGTGDSLTTGRIDLWKGYLEYLYTNPVKLLFGIGLGESLPFIKAPHNAYLEVIIYIGLTGTFIFCLTVYNAVAAAWNFPGRGTAVPFLFALLMYFFLGMYGSPDLQMELLLILGYLRINREDNMADKEMNKRGCINRGYEINLDCK